MVAVKTLKVAELKEELHKRGLDTKGLKKDLAERLEAAQEAETHGPSLGVDGVDGVDGVGRVDEMEVEVGWRGEDGSSAGLAPSTPAREPAPSTPERDPAAHGPREPSTPPMATADHAHGVGDVMVQGYPESGDDQASGDGVPGDLQPKALEQETAAVVAEWEANEEGPVRVLQRISPLPVDEVEAEDGVEDGVGDGVEGEMQVDVPTPHVHPKRSVSPPAAPPLTERPPGSRPGSPPRSPSAPAPAPSLGTVHPPTRVLYIQHLKRPFMHSALHQHIYASCPAPDVHPETLPAPSAPFASEEYPGLWLSGVKDHAFAVFPSTPAALDAATRLVDQRWPLETGETLSIEFVRPDRLLDIVQREEAAWRNGRQKLVLTLEKDQEGRVEFVLQGGAGRGSAPIRAGVQGGEGALGSLGSLGYAAPGRGGQGPGQRFQPYGRPPGGPAGFTPPGAHRGPPIAVPLTGTNAIGPPGGAVHMRGMGIRGRGGHGVGGQYGLAGARHGYAPRGAHAGAGGMGHDGPRGDRGAGGPFRPTRYQPRLMWRKGPGGESRPQGRENEVMGR